MKAKAAQRAKKSQSDSAENVALKNFKVTPVANDALNAYWTWRSPEIMPLIGKTKVYYFPLSENSGPHYMPTITDPQLTHVRIDNLTPDKNYRVCISVSKKGNLSNSEPDQQCVDVVAQMWPVSAFVGSAVGAFLALTIIIALVCISQRNKRRHRGLNRGVTSKRSRIDSTFESQFDSIAIRDETSFYDETTICESSYNSDSLGGYERIRGSMGAGAGCSNNSPTPPVARKTTPLLKEHRIRERSPDDAKRSNVKRDTSDIPSEGDSPESRADLTPDRVSLEPVGKEDLAVAISSPTEVASFGQSEEVSISEYSLQQSNPPGRVTETDIDVQVCPTPDYKTVNLSMQNNNTKTQTTTADGEIRNAGKGLPVNNYQNFTTEHSDTNASVPPNGSSVIPQTGIFTQLIETL